jgi:hypothetical protein
VWISCGNVNNKFTTLPIITFISLFKGELIGGVFNIFLFAMGGEEWNPILNMQRKIWELGKEISLD